MKSSYKIGSLYYYRDSTQVLFFRLEFFDIKDNLCSTFVIRRDGRTSFRTTWELPYDAVYEEVSMSQILDYYFDGELPPWYC